MSTYIAMTFTPNIEEGIRLWWRKMRVKGIASWSCKYGGLWHPTPVLLPGKPHGWRSLVGYSPWGRKESDTTERLHFHFSLMSSQLTWTKGHAIPMECCIHTMQFYSAIKRKEVLIHATLWINLENIILSERSQLQKSMYYRSYS